jgi:hypothetical protein
VTVSKALLADLDGMPEAVRNSTLAAGARVAAGILDSEPGARDAASLLKELRATMAELRAMADAAPAEEDPIDELSRRKAARQSGAHLSQRSVGGGGRVG